MKKIISLISFLLVFSFSFISPLYAAAHEKKAEDTIATEASSKEKTDTAAPDDMKKKEDGEAKEDEEPDCD